MFQDDTMTLYKKNGSFISGIIILTYSEKEREVVQVARDKQYKW